MSISEDTNISTNLHFNGRLILLRRPKKRKITKFILAERGANIALNQIRQFINRKINSFIEFKGRFLFRLRKEKYKDKKDMEEFLGKSIGVIFSGASTKEGKHNQDLIMELIESTNDIIRQYFQKLFSITFLEWMEHFTGKQYIKILVGLPRYVKVIFRVEFRKSDFNFTQKLIEFVKDYEANLYSIEPRKRRRFRTIKNQKKE